MSVLWVHEIKYYAVQLIATYTRVDYEVPGMILLCGLKGAMQRDSNKDMSLHVSTWTRYDFNALIPDVWKCSADKSYVCASHCKMSDQFLEQ